MRLSTKGFVFQSCCETNVTFQVRLQSCLTTLTSLHLFHSILLFLCRSCFPHTCLSSPSLCSTSFPQEPALLSSPWSQALFQRSAFRNTSACYKQASLASFKTPSSYCLQGRRMEKRYSRGTPLARPFICLDQQFPRFSAWNLLSGLVTSLPSALLRGTTLTLGTSYLDQSKLTPQE